MNTVRQKIENAVREAAENTKPGDVVSVSALAESIELTEQDKKEIQKELVMRAVRQLAAKGIPADISPEDLAKEVSMQIALNELSDDLDDHFEGDLFNRL